MKVTFYGTRGSIPIPEPDFFKVGGNTPCVLFTSDNGRIAIFDAGTGTRKLGNDLSARSHGQYDNIFIALSHTHWDHILGRQETSRTSSRRRCSVSTFLCPWKRWGQR